MDYNEYTDREKSPEVNLSECLAKTETGKEGRIPGMTVAQHLMLTGHTAGQLLEMRFKDCPLPFHPDVGRFVTACHDIGKISPNFQNRIYASLGDGVTAPPYIDTADSAFKEEVSHEKVGMSFLRKHGRSTGIKGDWISLGFIVGAHHGVEKEKINFPLDSQGYGGIPYNDCRVSLFRELLGMFPCDIPERLSDEEKRFLIGLTVVSDWISSDCRKSELGTEDFSSLAARKLHEAGFAPLRIRKDLSFRDIFSFEPRENQKAFYEAVRSRGVYILEEIMGGGKTEAALYAAYGLLRDGLASGIYFALPTRLTSLSIYERMEAFVRKITEDESDTRLIFRDSELFLCGESGETSPGSSWFDIGKKGILAPFGVGTVDQALMSVINVKHASLRSFGLAGKVLIIDELHSYDEYTGSLIRELVSLVKGLGGTVMILSATMRNASKEKVLGWAPERNEYPLITVSCENEHKEISSGAPDSKTVSLLHSDRETAMNKAVEMALEGNRVLWIENTVAEAQDIFRILSSRLAGSGIETGLLHSRFLQCDRKKNENMWMSVYGKHGKRDGRGKLLVGTQVLEQSLDIDSDFLVTNIAPADMIFQRIGRLWRHPSGNAERKCAGPECLIIHPDTEEIMKDPEKAFGVSSYVYPPYVLYRTAKTFEGVSTLTLPADIRPMIEKTYSDETPENGAIKSVLRNLEEKRREMERSARNAGSTNTNPGADDEAKTRYGDSPTSTVYIVRDFSISERTVSFTDGTSVKLTSSPNHGERVRIAGKLMMNSVTIRRKDVPDEAFEAKGISLISPYVYTGNPEDKKAGILMLRDGRIQDIYGNIIENHTYDDIIGYRKEK